MSGVVLRIRFCSPSYPNVTVVAPWVIWAARPDPNRARRGRNICLAAGLGLLVIAGLAISIRKQWSGDAQRAVDIAALAGLLGGPGALLIGWVLHIKRRG